MKLYITGMFCSNCRTRIEKKLRTTEGVRLASVNPIEETLNIEFDRDVLDISDIKTIVNDLGYGLSENGSFKRGQIIISLAATAVLFITVNHFGLLNFLVPGRLADSSMGYAALFLTGVLTSVHCMAMCGGINLSQSLLSSREQKTVRGAIHHPALLYNSGRVLSYTLTGTILGCVGLFTGISSTGVSTVLQGLLKTAAGIYMVLMGAGMMHILPMHKLSSHPFAGLISSIRRKGIRGPFVVGLLNGFMPCGPLQTVQLIALASGSPTTGALVMLSFGLGTVPLMFCFGTLFSMLGNRFKSCALTGGAVLLTVMGLSMLAQGYALAGAGAVYLSAVLACLTLMIYTLEKISLKTFVRRGLAAALVLAAVSGMLYCRGTLEKLSENNTSYKTEETLSKESSAERRSDMSDDKKMAMENGNNQPAQEQENVVQVVKTTLMPGRYPYIQVQAGMPVVWSIDVPERSLNMCNFRMFIKEYDIVHTFEEGENTIYFLPEKPGMYMYTCWMGMIRGLIKVI